MSRLTNGIAIFALLISVIVLLNTITTSQQIAIISEEIRSLKESVDTLNSKINTQVREYTATTIVSLTNGTAETESEIISRIFERVRESVVLVRVFHRFGESTGSGFVYDDKGHVITNYHVVENGLKFKVSFLDGSVFDAELTGSDPYSDLAVLKVLADSDIRFKPLKLGDSNKLRIGEKIIAIGNPFGLAGTVTSGIVSQKNRLLPTTRGFSIPGVIQIDAAINPGNSGGPLLNMKGEVVGVTTAIESPIRGFIGVGYAIPSSIVKRVVPNLITEGKYEHSWLGIAGRNLDSEIAKSMGLSLKRGFLVEEVVPNGPAAKAGIRGGDTKVNIDGNVVRIGGDVIIAINGNPVDSIETLLAYLEEKTNPGDTVTLTIIRDGEQMEISVVLGVRPPP